MTVLEQPPETKTHSACQSDLRVERTDISFRDVPGGKVRIQVTVHNAGAYRSRPTSLRLASAPFGAFVTWEPLTVLAVPALDPDESLEVSTEVARPHPAPLGSFDRVPPKKLLTAVSSFDQPSLPADTRLGNKPLSAFKEGDQPAPPARAGFARISLFMALALARGRGPRLAGTKPALPPDLLELLGRGNPHWAGNINVFIGSHPVERHMARALRIYPGRTNLAYFLVGDGVKPDAYAFDLVGLEPDWKARLYDVTNQNTLVISPSDAPIREARYVESRGGLVVVLATCPPADCQKGNLEVHVTRRSCGKTAIVEFNLDATAQGPGCYFV